MVNGYCVGWCNGVEAKAKGSEVGVHGGGKPAGDDGKKVVGSEYLFGWVGR